MIVNLQKQIKDKNSEISGKGTENQDVLVWTRSYERVALSSEQDEVQKYLFARKAAKLAVETNDNFRTWTEMSEYLKLRFSRKLTDK